MDYNKLMKFSSIIMLLFGVYLLQYGSYCLWGYRELLITEVVEKDANGMSRLVGFTFILMMGGLVFGLGLIIWLSRNVVDVESQQSMTLGLFATNVIAFSLSFIQQIVYWDSGWGKLYVTIFLALSLMFGYFRFIKSHTQ